MLILGFPENCFPGRTEKVQVCQLTSIFKKLKKDSLTQEKKSRYTNATMKSTVESAGVRSPPLPALSDVVYFNHIFTTAGRGDLR